MKTVNFEEFTAMLDGTIFSYYEPEVFIGLWRKGETIMGSWHGEAVQAIDYFQESLLPCYDTIEHVTIGERERWGEFNMNQLYCIYEPEDIDKLLVLLGRC